MLTRRVLLVRLVTTPAACTCLPSGAFVEPLVAIAADAPTWFVDHDGWIIPNVDRDLLVPEVRPRHGPFKAKWRPTD